MRMNYIKRNQINKWFGNYDIILSKPENQFVKRFLGKYLKKFVKNVDNPYEIPWIRGLKEERISWVDEFIKEFREKTKIPDRDIEKMFRELEGNYTDAVDIIRKIYSLSGEITALEHLVDIGYTGIKRIRKVGDWRTGRGERTSVKTLESIESKYEYFENVRKGLLCIEENEILRKYKGPIMKNFIDVDYKGMNVILKFMREYLCGILEKTEKLLRKKNQNIPYENIMDVVPKEGSSIEVVINGLKKKQNKYSINIEFCLGDKNPELKFESSDKPYMYISSIKDIDTKMASKTWGKEDKSRLIEKIKRKIDREYEREDVPEVIWISVILHTQFTHTPNKKRIIEEIGEKIEYDYGRYSSTIYLLFFPRPKFYDIEERLIEI